MSYDQDRQDHLNYKYKDSEFAEGETLTPLQEARLTLKQALRDSKLGYNVSTQNLITLALELLGEIDE